MKCIFCLEEKPESEEHVFPLAIGGSLVTDRVCRECNSFLGSKIDTGLTDFAPIRWKRGEFGLAGNSGTPPSPFNILDGEAKLIDDPDRRLKVRYNPETEQLDIESLYHKREVQLPDGTTAVQITVDEKERANIPKMIQRVRKRNGMALLTDQQMAEFLENLEVQEIKQPTFVLRQTIKFTYLRQAMLKIVYELAFMWLGEAYLCDPQAALIRDAILDPTTDKAKDIPGMAGLIPENNSAFSIWESHPTHHLAYGMPIGEQVAIAIRVFDLLEAVIPVTDHAEKYISNMTIQKELRFLVMDATSVAKYESSFLEETARIGRLMSIHRRYPPFPDPLANTP